MDRLTFHVAFLVLVGGAVAGANAQSRAVVLDPEAARDALIRFVKANPRAREVPATEEDLRKAKIAMEEDGTFRIHGIHVDPKARSYSRVVVAGLGPGQPGGNIVQCKGSFQLEDRGRWAVVNAKFSFTCVLARPPGK
jgi:hypothetical protein